MMSSVQPTGLVISFTGTADSQKDFLTVLAIFLTRQNGVIREGIESELVSHFFSTKS